MKEHVLVNSDTPIGGKYGYLDHKALPQASSPQWLLIKIQVTVLGRTEGVLPTAKSIALIHSFIHVIVYCVPVMSQPLG